MPYEPSEHSTSIYWARVGLLEAVKDVKPDVLAELCELSTFFKPAIHHLKEQHGQRIDLWAWEVIESKRPHATALQLRWAILAWAQKHHLNFDWCLRHAFYSLVHWETNRKSFKYGWAYDGLGQVAPITDDERKLVFELKEGWRPDLEDQEVFTKRANAAFKKALGEYVIRIVSLLQARKHVKTKQKYRALVDDFNDFKLLALKLVVGLGNNEILQKVIAAQKKRRIKKLTTYKAIESRIRRTAGLCGIDPKLLKQRNLS